MNKRKREDNKLYATTRKQAYERDGCCVLCGSSYWLQCHHIVFRSQGGKSELKNLACLCLQCHSEAHGVNAKEIRARLLEMVRDE